MNRREFLGHAGAAGLAGLAAGTAASAEGPPHRRPNVIFAFSDEHRWHSMAHTELPQLQTPHMDRLAAQGTSVRRCISNYPVCSPYRAMLLTGRWPWQTGVDDNGLTLREDEVTLGKVFRDAGYATGYIGKWHLGDTPRAEPYGFEHSLIWTGFGNHWSESSFHPKDGPAARPAGYDAALMTDQAIAFIEAQRANPFFLVLSWHPPHAPFTDPPEAKRALYPEGSLPRRGNTPEVSKGGGDGAFKFGWKPYQGYHGHVSAIDDELGRLMAALESRGLAENTILVYSSDHGSMLGSHGLGGKRQPYEESIRVPLIVRWPGEVPAGRTVEPLVGTIDLFPTLCGLAGVPVPAGRGGTDCSGLLRGTRDSGPEAQFIMHLRKDNASGGKAHPAPLFYGLRTRQHLYAMRDGAPWLLFDLAVDPLQQNNLCGKEGHRALEKELQQMLSAMTEGAPSLPTA